VANPCEVKVLHVKHSSSDEMTVLVRDTAAVLTLRGVKLFTHAGGDSCGAETTTTTTTTSTRGATRMDIFDVERDAVFIASDFGVWNVNTSVLDGASLVATQATATSCTGGGGVVDVKHGQVKRACEWHGPPKRRQRTSMV